MWKDILVLVKKLLLGVTLRMIRERCAVHPAFPMHIRWLLSPCPCFVSCCNRFGLASSSSALYTCMFDRLRPHVWSWICCMLVSNSGTVVINNVFDGGIKGTVLTILFLLCCGLSSFCEMLFQCWRLCKIKDLESRDKWNIIIRIPQCKQWCVWKTDFFAAIASKLVETKRFIAQFSYWAIITDIWA